MLYDVPLAIALAILGAALPFANAILPGTATTAPAVTGTAGSSGTASPIKAQSTTQRAYLTAIPERTAAPPLPDTATFRRIHPNGRPDLCLTVQGGELVAGATLGVFYCHPFSEPRAKWQLFDVSGAQSSATGGLIIVGDSGTLCVSLGNDFSNGARPRLERCVAKELAQAKGQGWTVTVWSIRNTKDQCNQCLDIRMTSAVYEGKTWDSCRDVQTWTCEAADTDNPHQVWSLMHPGGVLAGSTPDTRRRDIFRRGSRL